MENIVITAIGAFQAVILGFIAYLTAKLNKVNKATQATKDQIVNHHPEQPNFREENDRRHAETKRWFMQLKNELTGVKTYMEAGFRSTHDRWDELTTWALENRERIESIENTAQTRKGK